MLSTIGSKSTSDEVKLLMEHIDQNGDGYIDLKEFADFHYNYDDAAAGKDVEIREMLSTFTTLTRTVSSLPMNCTSFLTNLAVGWCPVIVLFAAILFRSAAAVQ
ncbi:EF hand protein [Medicago truncatula]|uniref:EF hand protein n=1 Tax=Medicago truncatula TaxID=3880 RepID=A0A072VIF2_MEDTR|nr:EF hand protein [Medicago truncatula]